MRRYCVANGTDRMATLTFADEPDVDGMWKAWKECARRLRRADVDLGPWACVPEWGELNGRKHLHVALSRFVPHGLLANAWGEGFVSINRLDKTKDGRPIPEEVRPVIAASYVAGYCSMTAEERVLDRRRYSVARGYQPQKVTITDASTRQEARTWLDAASSGKPPRLRISSEDVDDYQGPPWDVLRW